MNSTGNFSCPKMKYVWYVFPYNISMFVLSLLVILAALTANVLVCIAVFINPKLRQNVASYFIISLAISDIAAAAFSMPFDLESFTTFGRWYHNEMLCIVWTSSYLITIPTSMWNLFILSIDRYRTLSNPWDRFKQTPFMTKRRAILALGVVWVFSILCALVPQMGWKYSDSSLYTMNECSGTTCIFNITPLYSILSSVVNFYLPMLAMCFIYFKIYQIASTQHIKPSLTPKLEMSRYASNSTVEKLNTQQKNLILENKEKSIEKFPSEGNRRWEIELIGGERIDEIHDLDSCPDIACHGHMNDERHDNKDGSTERMRNENEWQEATTKGDINECNGHVDKQTEEIKTKKSTANLDHCEENNELLQCDNTISLIAETGNYEENINIGNGIVGDEDRRLLQENAFEPPEEVGQNIDVTEVASSATEITNKTDAQNTNANISDDENDIHMRFSTNGYPVPSQNDVQVDDEHNSKESIDIAKSSPHHIPDHVDIPVEMQNLIYKNEIPDGRGKSASKESVESTCTLQSTLTYNVNRVNIFGSRDTINNIAFVDIVTKRRKIFVKNKKAARTVSIIVGAFLLCWLPRTTFSIVHNVCQNRCFTTVQEMHVLYASHVSLLVGYLSTVINPIVYSCRNVQFRRSYRRMVRKLLPCLKARPD